MLPSSDRSLRAGLALSFIGLATILFAISLELSIMADSLQGVPVLLSLIGLVLTVIGGVQLMTPHS